MTHSKLAVIDDDPTGAQAEAGVPLLLAWPPEALADRQNAGAVHLLTNSRALDEAGAYAIVRDAAAAALAAMPERRLVLRGDSTLRGHLLPEYEAVRDAAAGPDREPVLVLVPALPAAGRVTVGGVHLIERGGTRVPLDATEYARDRSFGYASSRLLDWAAERSAAHWSARPATSARPTVASCTWASCAPRGGARRSPPRCARWRTPGGRRCSRPTPSRSPTSR